MHCKITEDLRFKKNELRVASFEFQDLLPFYFHVLGASFGPRASGPELRAPRLGPQASSLGPQAPKPRARAPSLGPAASGSEPGLEKKQFEKKKCRITILRYFDKIPAPSFKETKLRVLLNVYFKASGPELQAPSLLGPRASGPKLWAPSLKETKLDPGLRALSFYFKSSVPETRASSPKLRSPSLRVGVWLGPEPRASSLRLRAWLGGILPDNSGFVSGPSFGS